VLVIFYYPKKEGASSMKTQVLRRLVAVGVFASAGLLAFSAWAGDDMSNRAGNSDEMGTGGSGATTTATGTTVNDSTTTHNSTAVKGSDAMGTDTTNDAAIPNATGGSGDAAAADTGTATTTTTTKKAKKVKKTTKKADSADSAGDAAK
jgi:hypothetical protein